MKKRRLRILKFAAMAAALLLLAWGASAIAVYAASSGRDSPPQPQVSRPARNAPTATQGSVG